MTPTSFQVGPTASATVMRVVGYVRVSTDEQGVSGLGLEAQRTAIVAECHRRGWTLACTEIDVAGGAKLDRPGLNAAVEAVACGDVDGLVVAKLDRLSRSVADFSALLERFRSKGWGLVILDLGIDTTRIVGEAMATMAATFAQVERRRIGERTREALAVRRAQECSSAGPRGWRRRPSAGFCASERRGRRLRRSRLVRFFPSVHPIGE